MPMNVESDWPVRSQDHNLTDVSLLPWTAEGQRSTDLELNADWYSSFCRSGLEDGQKLPPL